ncbi:hypothetical protein [uncultured Maribacter sp.]|uniref:hypothetical protein n=1 Tax=uncultured Maribacter sp. TaxID=431308 RepID=UPI002617ED4B|nr:hypothetical protein [uncultured Maribacter sp.]
MKKIIFSIITALGCITDEFFTFKYVCDYPEHGPEFYGFPFVQETNTSWIFSMSGEIYLFGFLGNLVLWTLFIFILVVCLHKIKGKLAQKIIPVFGWLIMAWSILVSFVYFGAIDWRLKYTHDDFKINYYQSYIACEREFLWIK